MSLPYPSWNVVFGETPTSSKWSQLGANDDALAAGTGFNTGAIPTAALAAASVTPDKLKLSPVNAPVATSEATGSASYADLATSGPSVTAIIGLNGLALVSWGAEIFSAGAGWPAYVSFAASGANTITAGTYEVQAKSAAANSDVPSYRTKLLTGLTPGSTTFKLQYKSPSGSSTFYNREISVVPL